MFALIGIIIGFALSFLSFGILWSGINQWAQAAPPLLFFIAGYFLAKKSVNALLHLYIGAAPLAGILVMFRDKEGSHALGIAIVLSWAIAAALGVKLSGKYKTSKKQA